MSTPMTVIDNNTLNPENIVVVPDFKPNAQTGMLVHWRLKGMVERERLDSVLSDILPSNYMPTKSKSDKYLARAMETLKFDRRSDMVRKLSKGSGMSLVSEDASHIDLEHVSETDNDEAYKVRLTAKIEVDPNGNEVLRITPKNHPHAEKLKEEFEIQKGLYNASVDLSQWLSVKIMALVNAVSYRERGGVYVLSPGEDIGRFEEIAKALASVSQFDANGRLLAGCKIYTIPVVAGENLQEAVIDSLMEDLDDLVKDITEKVTENKLTIKGWNSQREVINVAQARFKKFENFLGISLKTLTDQLSELEKNIGSMEAAAYFEKEQERKNKGKK